MTTQSLNWQRINERLVGRAQEALSETLDWVQEKARDRAPVRDVFQRTAKPVEQMSATGRFKRGIEYTRSGTVKRDSEGKAIFKRRTYSSQRTQRDFVKMVDAQRTKRRQAYVQFPDSGGSLKPTRVRGNVFTADSENLRVGTMIGGRRKGQLPVFAPGIRRVSHMTPTGPRFKRDKEGNIELPAATVYTKRGEVTKFKGSDLTAAQFLGYRGRYELKRANALITKLQDKGNLDRLGSSLDEAGLGLRQKPGGELELGGRLRDSIERTDVRDDGKIMSGEVYTDVYYARYQEYGTSRHRAQPFMRPALYEGRQQLVNRLKRVLGRKYA